MAISSIPDNVNFLSPIGFRLLAQDLPQVEFYCQSANVPGVNLGEIQTPTPYNPIYHTGDVVSYEDLAVRVLADEYMKNWSEIHDWIIGLGAPKSHDQYAAQAKKFLKTALTLIIMTAGNTPSIQFEFEDAFPTSLSGLQFDSGGQGGEYLTFDVSFRYNMYTYRSLLNN